jgi:hypothetical protein
MQFCADLSHWALVQVLDDFNKQATLWKYPKPDMFQTWGPILDRTSVIQCRISDGIRCKLTWRWNFRLPAID